MNLAQRFPIGHAVVMAQQHIDPYPVLTQMLTHEPVSWVDELGMWYVTRRDDVLRILADTDTFTVVSDKSLMRQAMGYNMLTTDGTEQARLRRPFNGSFAPRRIRHYAESFVASLANQLIDTFIAQDTVDLKADFADIIAIQTVVDMIGLQVDDVEQIRSWVSDFSHIMSNFSGDETIIERGEQSKREFASYVQGHIDRFHETPDDSILGQMVQSADHHMSDAELIDSVRVIIFGGVETTSALITNTLYCLLIHPEQMQRLLDNPDEYLPNAIEETLRYESPVQTCTRHVLRDVEVNGVQLRAGDTLQCMLGAANRDPSHFDNPNQFDILRDNARDHLAFANGKHFCIGAGLARMEATVGIRTLLSRMPHMELTVLDDNQPIGYEFRSSKCLQINI